MPPITALPRSNQKAAKAAWINPPTHRTRLDHGESTGLTTRSVASDVIATAFMVVPSTVAVRRNPPAGQRANIDGSEIRRSDLTPVNVQASMYACQANPLSCSQCLRPHDETATLAAKANGSAPR